MVTIRTGTLIHGTHRMQDLIPVFLDAVATFNKPGYAGLTAQPFGVIPAYVQDEGDSSEWWDSDDALHLFDELFDLLNDIAPDGTYFGTHPGDGSDYGFWSVTLLDNTGGEA